MIIETTEEKEEEQEYDSYIYAIIYDTEGKQDQLRGEKLQSLDADPCSLIDYLEATIRIIAANLNTAEIEIARLKRNQESISYACKSALRASQEADMKWKATVEDEEEERECCNVCGFAPEIGNIVYQDDGRRPLCYRCNAKRPTP